MVVCSQWLHLRRFAKDGEREKKVCAPPRYACRNTRHTLSRTEAHTHKSHFAVDGLASCLFGACHCSLWRIDKSCSVPKPGKGGVPTDFQFAVRVQFFFFVQSISFAAVVKTSFCRMRVLPPKISLAVHEWRDCQVELSSITEYKYFSP